MTFPNARDCEHGHLRRKSEQFDRWVAECFPNEPLAKYHAGVRLCADGSVVVSYNGKEVTVVPPSKTDA